jgi:hypothetical protein
VRNSLWAYSRQYVFDLLRTLLSTIWIERTEHAVTQGFPTINNTFDIYVIHSSESDTDSEDIGKRARSHRVFALAGYLVALNQNYYRSTDILRSYLINVFR